MTVYVMDGRFGPYVQLGETPEKGTSKGWHVVETAGLPNRYITSVAVDPRNAANVFVTLGGYTRRWVPPGAVGDTNAQLGTGHVYRSLDGGKPLPSPSRLPAL